MKTAAGTVAVPQKVRPCTLQDNTHKFIKLIFDTDMFKEAMSNFKIDVKKMPLGQISRSQIAKCDCVSIF